MQDKAAIRPCETCGKDKQDGKRECTTCRVRRHRQLHPYVSVAGTSTGPGRGRGLRRKRPLADRLWAKVEKADVDACWEWTGSRTPHGYGQIRESGVGSALVHAHRVAYEAAVGPIPEGLEIDHLCRNRACCNPAHLEPVTHQENIQRGYDRAMADRRAGWRNAVSS
jgi:hypothetical protein